MHVLLLQFLDAEGQAESLFAPNSSLHSHAEVVKVLFQQKDQTTVVLDLLALHRVVVLVEHSLLVVVAEEADYTFPHIVAGLDNSIQAVDTVVDTVQKEKKKNN